MIKTILLFAILSVQIITLRVLYTKTSEFGKSDEGKEMTKSSFDSHNDIKSDVNDNYMSKAEKEVFQDSLNGDNDPTKDELKENDTSKSSNVSSTKQSSSKKTTGNNKSKPKTEEKSKSTSASGLSSKNTYEKNAASIFSALDQKVELTDPGVPEPTNPTIGTTPTNSFYSTNGAVNSQKSQEISDELKKALNNVIAQKNAVNTAPGAPAINPKAPELNQADSSSQIPVLSGLYSNSDASVY
ncbi:hypothetical protein GINT2_002264 [Glugoides intestinalis]